MISIFFNLLKIQKLQASPSDQVERERNTNYATNFYCSYPDIKNSEALGLPAVASVAQNQVLLSRLYILLNAKIFVCVCVCVYYQTPLPFLARFGSNFEQSHE